jgi:toxin ParE1/3/4
MASRLNKYIIAPSAQRDIDYVLDYIAARNPAAALRLSTKFREGFKLLAQYPNIGRPRYETSLKIFIIEGYVAAYRGERPMIEIVRIVHTKRDVETILKEHDQMH